jgi:hypothetical protein
MDIFIVVIVFVLFACVVTYRVYSAKMPLTCDLIKSKEVRNTGKTHLFSPIIYH